MSKHSLILLSIVIVSAPQLHPQTRPEMRTLVERAAAEHETFGNAAADEMHLRMRQELISRAIVERQARLKQDTEKLLALAAELKQRVDKTGPNILSLEVIKRAQEIEKLAKSVREKMRDAY